MPTFSPSTLDSPAIPLVPLAKGFKHVEEYQATGYELLPFRFMRWEDGRYFVSNLVGEYIFLPADAFHLFVKKRLPAGSEWFNDLKAKHLLYDGTSSVALDLLAAKYRTQRSGRKWLTGLHIFVTTLRCDHSCPYCQVSRVSQDRRAFDMTRETADRSLDLVFRSPSPLIKIEFQGGESLLNFDLVRYVVEEAKRRNDGSRLEFVIATNLSPLADDTPESEQILEFCREHSVYISTSIDGPAALHNANRPRPGGDGYERAVRGIERVRESLGHHSVAALMTTTLRSLDMPREIIDEYRRLGFASIFLRPISPFGFAVKSAQKIGYETEAFLKFYREGLAYILELNRGGERIREEYASIILSKALTSRPNGYVDLESPAGLGLSVMIYNYDGDVYASDEGRMLAEVGDKTFRLGNVHRDSYESLFLDSPLLPMIHDTMAEGIPVCNDCAFQPWCGTDPVFHHATQGDAVGHRPSSGFCRKNMGIFKILVDLMETDPFARQLFPEVGQVTATLPGAALTGQDALSLFGRLQPSGHAGIQILRLTEDAATPASEATSSGLLLESWPRDEGSSGDFAAVFVKQALETRPVETPESRLNQGTSTVIALPVNFHYLAEGDIVRYDGATGDLQVIYRRNSPFNHLFVTERCNSRCLMCSQPPRRVNDGFRVDDLLQAIPLMAPDTPVLGFTGGEITLLGDRFIELLEACKTHLPATHIQVLTNGRMFAYLPLAEQVAAVGIDSLVLCVPLYSDVDSEHDFVVQAKGAFDQTIRGLLNLARVGVRIEIRVVLHALTHKRLPRLAEFIARNLPFASHIALMGMEMTGYTRANLDALWIDPLDYQSELAESVDILDAAGLNVSIFNHQLCLLPEGLWRFSRQSISDWKNVYMPECASCAQKDNCGGFFASAKLLYSSNIRPFPQTGDSFIAEADPAVSLIPTSGTP